MAGEDVRSGAGDLRFERVHVRYPLRGGGSKLVLNDLSLYVRAGEFLTLVGPSGCGKSTLLHLVLGSGFPTEGSVTLGGKPIEGVGRDCGIVYQKYSLFPHVSVLDNVALGLLLSSTTIPERLNVLHLPRYLRKRREARERAHGFVERVGLARSDHDKYPHELSGGMRQRVAIAQALVMHPKILLMDEPFGALDHATRESMQVFLLEKWAELKMTVIFVTHDLEEACFLGSRIVGLSQYWSAEGGAPGEGAKVVLDQRTPGKDVNPTAFKDTPQFATFCANVHRMVLDARHQKLVSQFELEHPDSIPCDPVSGDRR